MFTFTLFPLCTTDRSVSWVGLGIVLGVVLVLKKGMIKECGKREEGRVYLRTVLLRREDEGRLGLDENKVKTENGKQKTKEF